MQTEPIGFKGTKGEWNKKTSILVGQMAIYAGGRIISMVDSHKTDYSKEEIANGDLLAASKKMAIALQKIRSEALSRLESGSDDPITANSFYGAVATLCENELKNAGL